MRGVQIRDDDPRTGIDERQRDRTVNAARSACHDRDSAVDSRGTSSIGIVIRMAKKSSVRQPSLEPFAVT
jgi:hypothetical protein